jgi:cold shock CspA family protein
MGEIGTCLWFDVKKGYGFIRRKKGGPDVFVHYSKIVAEPGEFRLLEENDVVEFEPFFAERGDGKQKPQAKNVRIIRGEHHADEIL